MPTTNMVFSEIEIKEKIIDLLLNNRKQNLQFCVIVIKPRRDHQSKAHRKHLNLYGHVPKKNVKMIANCFVLVQEHHYRLVIKMQIG